MNLNMKRVALGIIMAICLFSLSACSKSDTASSEIDASVQSQLEQLPASFLQMYTDLKDSDVDQFKKNMLQQDQFAVLAEGVDSWENVKDELGAFVSISDAVTVETVDHGYSATVNAVFEKRTMDFSITTDSRLTKITGVAFIPQYQFVERLEKAGLNTLMGMGTVFSVLIFISLLIGCFRHIGKLEEKLLNRGKKKEPVIEPAVTEEVSEEQPEEDLSDDLELVAVITAAIAASTGSSPSGLVVRSIKRASTGKWKKA
ncbi:OadG family transporter subunit [Clostridium sp. E02]|uniref:OadG family transporter subunit n=1 Tax=Clostridium sp. E02 TaxID=2487134 RepID=UPI000F538E55|nr:OadG family transporter subunit [Clostridium sp. E02]